MTFLSYIIGMEIVLPVPIVVASIISIFVFKSDKSFDLSFIGIKQDTKMAWLGTDQARPGVKGSFGRNQRDILFLFLLEIPPLSKLNSNWIANPISFYL
jgi:hypothetical protein